MTVAERLSRSSFRPFVLLSLLALASSGCGDAGSAGVGGAGGAIILDGTVEPPCDAPIPPDAEPELLQAPVFDAAELPPGSAVESEIEVDAETRTVLVELVNYWRLEDDPIDSVTLQTSGDELLSVSLATDSDTRGRYFFRITLCGDDCETRRILLTIVEDPASPNLRSDPYQRIVFEGDAEVGRATTCHWPDSVAIQ